MSNPSLVVPTFVVLSRRKQWVQVQQCSPRPSWRGRRTTMCSSTSGSFSDHLADNGVPSPERDLSCLDTWVSCLISHVVDETTRSRRRKMVMSDPFVQPKMMVLICAARVMEERSWLDGRCRFLCHGHLCCIHLCVCVCVCACVHACLCT